MRFGKLGLRGFGVIETEQRHAQIVVGMGQGRIEAHSLAVAVAAMWDTQATTLDPASYIPASKLPALSAARRKVAN